MAAAMKDVVGAAAGLTGLVLESARDLLQYMVRRGQMTQDEADKLMREVESSHSKKKPFVSPAASTSAGTKSAPTIGHTPHVAQKATSTQAKHAKPPAKHAKPPAKHAKPPAKHAKPPAKRSATAAKKPSAKKPTPKPAAKKHTTKSSSKSKPKASGKTAKRR
jgi:cell division septation protein DedD